MRKCKRRKEVNTAEAVVNKHTDRLIVLKIGGLDMKVAYVFATTNCQKILSKMIVPQLEMDGHGAKVVGMFFLCG